MSKDLNSAVLAIQSEIGTLQKNAINPHFRSKYLSLDALVEHVQPLLTKHGLIWITRPSSGGQWGTTPVLFYQLIHAESGDAIEDTMPLLLDKQNAQGQGSAITYARRYALCAVLNIVADVDDDGNKAAAKKATTAQTAPIPDDFASQLRATKMKAGDIKAWLQTDGGYDGKVVTPLSGAELAKFLNNLNEGEQDNLLFWAKGDAPKLAEPVANG